MMQTRASSYDTMIGEMYYVKNSLGDDNFLTSLGIGTNVFIHS